MSINSRIAGKLLRISIFASLMADWKREGPRNFKLWRMESLLSIYFIKTCFKHEAHYQFTRLHSKNCVFKVLLVTKIQKIQRWRCWIHWSRDWWDFVVCILKFAVPSIGDIPCKFYFELKRYFHMWIKLYYCCFCVVWRCLCCSWRINLLTPCCLNNPCCFWCVPITMKIMLAL